MNRARRNAAAALFLGALALYTLTAGGSLTSSDSVTVFALTASLVDRHSIALPDDNAGLDASPGVNGRSYSRYGIGQSIYDIPFYLAGKAAMRALGRPIGRPDSVPKAVVALGSAVAAAGCVLAIWLLSLRLGATARGAFIAAVSAAVASPLWPYSKFGFSTALTALILLTSAWFLADREPRRQVWSAASAGLVLAFGWLTRHEMAIVLVPFVAVVVLTRGASRVETWRRAGALVGCAATGGLLWAWYNAARFGDPFSVGYSPGFDGSGYAAFLLSPAGSVVLFAPIVIVWIYGIFTRAAGTAERVLLAGPLIAFYAFYGALVDWPGGRSYGPRYLIPGLLLLSPGVAFLWPRGRRWRSAIVAAVIAGAVLQLPGVLVDYSKVSIAWARSASRDQVDRRNWTMAASPLVLNARAAWPALSQNASYLSGREPVPQVASTGAADDREFAQRFAFSLDFWWLYLFYLRVLGAGAAAGMAAALAIASTVCTVVAWKLSGG